MGAYGDNMLWWRRMPPISQDECRRLPRGESYSEERDSGRAIIALRWPKLWKGRVFVRNVFTPRNDFNGFVKEWRAKHGSDPVAVENMREFDQMWSRLKVAESGKTGSYVPATRARKFRHTYLHTLKERGWEVVAGPFLVEEPMHNCMLDLTEKEWAELWATQRTKPWAVQHLARQTSSRFMDTEESPMASEIRLHYRALGVCEGWTPERVKALADAWGMTPRELQHYICCETVVMERFMAGKLPTLPGPICLWLFFMERMLASRAGEQFTDSLFPVLGRQSSTAADAAA